MGVKHHKLQARFQVGARWQERGRGPYGAVGALANTAFARPPLKSKRQVVAGVSGPNLCHEYINIMSLLA